MVNYLFWNIQIYQNCYKLRFYQSTDSIGTVVVGNVNPDTSITFGSKAVFNSENI